MRLLIADSAAPQLQSGWTATSGLRYAEKVHLSSCGNVIVASCEFVVSCKSKEKEKLRLNMVFCTGWVFSNLCLVRQAEARHHPSRYRGLSYQPVRVLICLSIEGSGSPNSSCVYEISVEQRLDLGVITLLRLAQVDTYYEQRD